MAEIFRPSPKMQDIYEKDKDKYKESDKLINEGDLKGAAEVHPDRKELKGNLFRSIAGGTYEIGAGIAFDVATAPFAWTGPVYAAANFGEGAISNIIGQLIRGEEFNWSEVASSGALGMVPLTSLRAAKYLKRPAARTVENVIGKGGTLKRFATSGAITGVADRTIQAGLGEQRLPTTGEVVGGALTGGVVGTGFKAVPGTINLAKRLQQQINEATNTVRVAATGGLEVGQARDVSGGDDIPLSQRMADADLSQVPDDALDINIRRTKIYDPVFYEKQFNRMKEWGMEDGVFDYFQFRTLKETKQKGPTPSRAFAEFFQSIREYAENYKGVVRYKRPEFETRWKDFLKARKIDPKAIQLHHIDLLQDSMGLYHNVQFDSDEWWDITATLLRANVRPGTTNWSRLKGKDNPNLRYVLGYSGQEDMPHGVAHKLYRDELDAKGFFDNEEILKMSIDPKYRIEKVKAFAKIVNRSEDILEQAMKTFNSLNPKGDMDYTATVNFLNTLNKEGLLPTKLIEGKYQVPQMKDLILDIRKQMKDLPPTIRVDSETFEYWLLNKLLDYYDGVNPNILGGVRRRIKKRYGKKRL